MGNSCLPNIGDIITFSGMWHESLSINESGLFPHGIVTAISRYKTVVNIDGEHEFWGTLAYPITISDIYIDDSMIYVVQWATSNSNIISSYRLINEEWFYNGSFEIISRA